MVSPGHSSCQEVGMQCDGMLAHWMPRISSETWASMLSRELAGLDAAVRLQTPDMMPLTIRLFRSVRTDSAG